MPIRTETDGRPPSRRRAGRRLVGIAAGLTATLALLAFLPIPGGTVFVVVPPGGIGIIDLDQVHNDPDEIDPDIEPENFKSFPQGLHLENGPYGRACTLRLRNRFFRMVR
jgi:hypothetical protein